MNGASFLLVVNFLVAMSFCAVFIVVAKNSRSRSAAIWIAAGFGVASLSALCELLVAYTSLTKVWALGAFATVLVGMVMLKVGIGELYHRQFDRRLIAVFTGASLILAYMIYDLPRGTSTHAFLYQAPFAVVVLTSAWMVLSSNRRMTVDRFLGGLLLITGLHFIGKAALAVAVGSGGVAKNYIYSNYALVSQSSTAVLMVGIGLTLLAALILEILMDQRTESEIDLLSGVANRRGFDRRVRNLLQQTPGTTHAVVLCDMDHFKRINDTFGHATGDRVIEGFGQRLRTCVPDDAVVGRIGGEEFAIFLPDTQPDIAMRLAEDLRMETGKMAGLPDSLKVTASFGVASVSAGGDLTEAFRQADIALYAAKNAGRNRVKLADPNRVRKTDNMLH
ncbi:GGDEF domain-containing protein [Rhizobium glycinendophyticum]|uniref:diguanylate cyclase n=1 Tax=Rhizobium glycinendophyticum TaxID=2589807 RepID=A0A504U2L1_9HYPH|nr:GGDEF domain-containing protein [Rhizobium glycinendophyticum]TPP04595.1 GGDEF domain-containing protein [Rhizobium glycinendophyticum]